MQQTGEGAGESPAPQNWAHAAKGAHPYRKVCKSRGIKVAAPPKDSPCDGPVTCPEDIKTLVKSIRGKSGPILDMTTRLGLTDKDLGKRMDKNRIPKQALQYKPKGRRNIGRPRKRWRDQLHFEDQGTGNMPNPS